MANKKKTLAEAMADSAYLSDVSEMRALIEKKLASRDPGYGDGPCADALQFLIPILGRRDVVKERFLATGNDWFRALDNADAPGWEAWTAALEKSDMDVYHALKAWKGACMRRRPEGS